MQTFEEWSNDNQIIFNGTTFKQIQEAAYKAGWDACRDMWSGMDYDATKKMENDDD